MSGRRNLLILGLVIAALLVLVVVLLRTTGADAGSPDGALFPERPGAMVTDVERNMGQPIVVSDVRATALISSLSPNFRGGTDYFVVRIRLDNEADSARQVGPEQFSVLGPDGALAPAEADPTVPGLLESMELPPGEATGGRVLVPAEGTGDFYLVWEGDGARGVWPLVR